MLGVLNLNKPLGPTSHDIVARVRRILREKRVGHAGTLDPLATGVLVVAVGRATRIVEYLVAQEKEYSAEMLLGKTTTTQDSDGVETSSADASHITREMVEEVLPQFTGRIMQIPPMVSAVKHEGKRLYELARKDIEVERQPREITIHDLKITSFTPGTNPIVGLDVTCSSGTYIRTICADIGEVLGVGGYMKSLVRTRVGQFDLKCAIDLETLEKAAEEGRLDELIIPMDAALSNLPSVDISSAQKAIIANGGTIQTTSSAPYGALVKVLADGGELVAIGRLQQHEEMRFIKPEKVFTEAGQ